MKTVNSLPLTVTRLFAPIPPETQAELDLLCELYGRTLQKFQMAFCTHELVDKKFGTGVPSEMNCLLPKSSAAEVRNFA